MTSQNVSGFAVITKSVENLCSQLSIINIQVPKFDDTVGVFNFIKEFEASTVTLTNEQKPILLVKSFLNTKRRPWFELELKPLIDGKALWPDIKKRIIDRFELTEDKDRHFNRLLNLKFSPESDQQLLDFIDEVSYSYDKAYLDKNDPEGKVRFIKALLPSQVKMKLWTHNDYLQNTTFNKLKESAKYYDLMKAENSNSKETDKAMSTSQLVSVMKELIEGIKAEGKNTRDAIAVSQTEIQSYHRRYKSPSPPYRRSNKRSPTPRRYSHSSDRDRSSSANRKYSKERKPQLSSPKESHSKTDIDSWESGDQYRYNHDNSRNLPSSRQYSPDFRQSRSRQRYDKGLRFNADNSSRYDNLNDQQKSEKESNSVKKTRSFWEGYHERFGRPPTPCHICGSPHWERHCFNNLKV